MWHRRLILGFRFMGILLPIYLVIAFYFANHPDGGPQITELGCARLRIGMSEKEVEFILGCPAGDYRNRNVSYPAVVSRVSDGNEYSKLWRGNHGEIVVYFAPRSDLTKAKVRQTFFHPSIPPDWYQWRQGLWKWPPLI